VVAHGAHAPGRAGTGGVVTGRVDIIIVNYNTRDDLAACLPRSPKHGLPARHR
jgi:hypothetical protein